MAKGDDQRARNAIDYRGNTAQNTLSNLRQGAIDPTYSQISNQYQTSLNRVNQDYGNIMDQYKTFQTTALPDVKADQVAYNRSPEMNEAFQNYRNFAQTGGFSNEDIANMRARGVSPIRSVYANAQNELKRQRALQGGYSPNFTAATAKMSGQLGQQIADAVQNVNAGLAEQIQKGKMFGTEGFGGLSTKDTEFGQQAALANQAANLRASEINRTTTDPLRLQAIQGQASLFGTSPGMASTFGNQVLGAIGQANTSQGQQNQLGLGIPENTINAGRLPGRWDSTIGRIGDIAKIGAGLFDPTGGIASSIFNRLPSSGSIYRENGSPIYS